MNPTGNHDNQQSGDQRGPGVRIPPPLVFLAALIVAGVLNSVWPAPFPAWALLPIFGALLTLVSLAVLVMIALMFRRHATAIEPWKPTTSFIRHGIYAYSRNPIYTAFCCVVIGVGLLFQNLWMILSFIPAAVIVYYTAIAREEVYLESKFGEEYRHYKAQVRRWL